MDSSKKSNAGLSSADLLMRALGNRLSLAGIELQEIRAVLVGISFGALIAAGLLQMGILMLLILVTALSWDTEWRVLTPSLAAGVLFTGGSYLGWRVWKRASEFVPLEETFRQISADVDAVKQTVGGNPSGNNDESKEANDEAEG